MGNNAKETNKVKEVYLPNIGKRNIKKNVALDIALWACWLILGFGIGFYFGSSKVNAAVMTEDDVHSMAEDISEDHFSGMISPEFLTAVAYTESRYTPDVNQHGLMQINARWQKDRMASLGVTDLQDPYQNMKLAAGYLVDLFSEYQDPGMVLMVYNMGPEDAEKFDSNNKLSSYAKNVLKLSAKLEEKYGKI